MKTILAAMVLLGGVTRANSAPAPVQYKLKTQYLIGGVEGWDYLAFDSPRQRLYISRGTKVVVVDPKNGAVLSEIPGTLGVHGIALAPGLDKGFTSNGKANSITVFNLNNFHVISEIKISGDNPDAILYEPKSKRVLTFNGKSRDATVIDAVKGNALANIPLGGKPEFAAADGAGFVYVNIEDANELVVIDAAQSAVVKRWPLTGCDEPSGLAFDAASRRAFAACHNKSLLVVDGDSGSIVATLPIGAGVDAAAFDPGKKFVFTSNGEGTLSVIHEDDPNKFSVVGNFATQKGARTMALDTSSHNVYLVTADVKEEPAADGGRPKRTVIPDTFRVVVMTP